MTLFGMLCRAVAQKLTDVSEVLIASIIMAKRPHDGVSKHLRNFSKFLRYYTAQHLRGVSSYSPLWEPEISLCIHTTAIFYFFCRPTRLRGQVVPMVWDYGLSGYHSCFVFWRSRIQILAGRPAVMTWSFSWFSLVFPGICLDSMLN
jgi:hypothetical protein